MLQAVSVAEVVNAVASTLTKVSFYFIMHGEYIANVTQYCAYKEARKSTKFTFLLQVVLSCIFLDVFRFVLPTIMCKGVNKTVIFTIG